jgi:hypothetical protein
MNDFQHETSVELFVNEYETYSKLAAEHVVRKFGIIAQAKSTLSYRGFEQFCTEIHLKHTSSKCRKFIKVGAESDWLLPIAAHLPAEWTTIYEVAKLGPAVANELIRSGILNPEMSAKQLKAAVWVDDETRKDFAYDQAGEDIVIIYMYTIDPSGLAIHEQKKLYCDLDRVAQSYGVTVVRVRKVELEQTIIAEEAA